MKNIINSDSYISTVDITETIEPADLYKLARTDSVVALCVSRLSQEAAKLGYVFTKGDDKEIEIVDSKSERVFTQALAKALNEYLITGNFLMGCLTIGSAKYYSAFTTADVQIKTMSGTEVTVAERVYTFNQEKGLYVSKQDENRTLAVHQNLIVKAFNEHQSFSHLISCYTMAKTHALILETNVNFLQKGSNLGGILSEDGEGNLPSTTVQIQEQLSFYKRVIQGAKKAGEILYTPKSLKFTPTTITNKEGGYIALEKITTERICASFGVPIQYVSGQYSTYNNLEESSYQLQRSAQTLLHEVVPAIGKILQVDPDVSVNPSESDVELRGEKEQVKTIVLNNAKLLQELGKDEAYIDTYLEENL